MRSGEREGGERMSEGRPRAKGGFAAVSVSVLSEVYCVRTKVSNSKVVELK